MSTILDLGALRRTTADLLVEMGLVQREKALCSRTCDNAAPMRRELLAIRELATEMHSRAVHAATTSTVIEALAHAKTAAQALKLEKLAAEAIVVADRRLAEMAEDNAKGCEPGLSMSAKPYGGWR